MRVFQLYLTGSCSLYNWFALSRKKAADVLEMFVTGAGLAYFSGVKSIFLSKEFSLWNQRRDFPGKPLRGSKSRRSNHHHRHMGLSKVDGASSLMTL
jgi:hypothetical protein